MGDRIGMQRLEGVDLAAGFVPQLGHETDQIG
jgi:hypothetical protein